MPKHTHTQRATPTRRQALLALLGAAAWPHDALVYPAAVGLTAANAWLLRNMLRALGVYRKHLLVIANSPPKAPHP